jgi:hypothetical protein
MISTVPSVSSHVSSVHVELDGRQPSTTGRIDKTTKYRIVEVVMLKNIVGGSVDGDGRNSEMIFSSGGGD